jgi:pyruvate dehydrogenase E2 component (dihydrolipoamide acetyltransferase)
MPIILNLPKIGVNMTEAQIIEWVVKEGDIIKTGDHILNAETDKTTQEIFSTESGILAKIVAGNGVKVEVQKPIAILTAEGEIFDPDTVMSEAPAPIQKAPEAHVSEDIKKYATTATTTSINTGRIKISPLAKKMASERGIDLRLLTPSEPAGRIVKKDILEFRPFSNTATLTAAPAYVTEGDYDAIPFSGVRKIIAERLSESNLTKPAAALTLHADAGAILEWRSQLKKAGIIVGYNEMLALIVSRALRAHPMINSVLSGNEIRLLKDINVGIAVDTEKGLMVPVIRNTDRKSLGEIGKDFTDAVARVKAGSATSADLTGGTFTITNLGMYEIEQFTPIINPPECCILAVGAIVRQAVPDEDDKIVVRSRMQLTLAFDHRMVDGAPAAKFLQTVKHMIENPLNILI